MQYRKKPIVIEAMHFTTNNEDGSPQMDSIVEWVNGHDPDGPKNAGHNGTDIYINTLEGEMRASVGDWIIRGIKGEFYPIKDAIFKETYEEVTE